MKKKVKPLLKRKYDIAIGELEHKRITECMSRILKTKIKVSGRSYKSGKRKTVSLKVEDILQGVA